MRNLKEKIITSFTYEELVILKYYLSLHKERTEFEENLISKINNLITEGEKWF